MSSPGPPPPLATCRGGPRVRPPHAHSPPEQGLATASRPTGSTGRPRSCERREATHPAAPSAMSQIPSRPPRTRKRRPQHQRHQDAQVSPIPGNLGILMPWPFHPKGELSMIMITLPEGPQNLCSSPTTQQRGRTQCPAPLSRVIGFHYEPTGSARACTRPISSWNEISTSPPPGAVEVNTCASPAPRVTCSSATTAPSTT